MKTVVSSLVAVLLCSASFADVVNEQEQGDPAKILKRDVMDFRFSLTPFLESDKPYYSLTLSVSKDENENKRGFAPAVQIDQKQANKMIDYMEKSGALKRGTNYPLGKILHGYISHVSVKNWFLAENLGFSLKTLAWLDGLHEVLEGEAKKQMGILLGRLSGHRKVWEQQEKLKQELGVKFVSDQMHNKLTLSKKNETTIFQITSRTGIGRLKVSRVGKSWPESIHIHLHLRGLESLSLETKDHNLGWSIPSRAPYTSFVMMKKDRKEISLKESDPFYSEAKIVGGNGKIPLNGGYFDLQVPKKVLEKNPEFIHLHWIDFYRN